MNSPSQVAPQRCVGVAVMRNLVLSWNLLLCNCCVDTPGITRLLCRQPCSHKDRGVGNPGVTEWGVSTPGVTQKCECHLRQHTLACGQHVDRWGSGHSRSPHTLQSGHSRNHTHWIMHTFGVTQRGMQALLGSD